MKRTFLVALMAFGGAMAANATTVTLSAVNGNVYQGSAQNPCIFANSSCNNPSFPSTAVPNGNQSSYDLLSPIYTGSQLLAIMNGGGLNVGLDINDNNNAQTLTLFTMIVNGVLTDTYGGTTGNVPDVNNGNGYADYILSGFTPFSAIDTVQFHFVFNDANAGAENVFVIAGNSVAAAVPEPTSLALLGASLAVIGLVRRRSGR